MYVSMFKDLGVLRVILILATLIVINLDPGIGVFRVGQVLPFPMWLFCPHRVGLLDFIKDGLADDMLLEIRKHLCVGQHCVDTFKKCCLWVRRLAKCPCHLIDCEFALVEQLLVIHGGELHQVQIVCAC